MPSQWFAAPQQVTYQGDYDPTYVPEQEHQLSYDEHQQVAGARAGPGTGAARAGARAAGPGADRCRRHASARQGHPRGGPAACPGSRPRLTDEDLYQVFRHSIEGEGMPTPGAFAANLQAQYGIRLQSRDLNRYMDQFSDRLNAELMDEHIA